MFYVSGLGAVNPRALCRPISDPAGLARRIEMAREMTRRGASAEELLALGLPTPEMIQNLAQMLAERARQMRACLYL